MSEEDDTPASLEELAAAARLARALDEDAGAEQIRAAAGKAAPLGELRARGLARAAVAQASRPRRRWRWAAAASLLVAALLLLWLGARPSPLPERLQARSAGTLIPGPFPSTQSASNRLDLVTADRLIAFREARCRAVQRGER
jgi:hypothetical protein